MTQPKGMWCAGVGVGFSEPLGPGEPVVSLVGFLCVSSSLLVDVARCCTLPCHPAERDLAFSPWLLPGLPLLSVFSSLSPHNPLPRVFLRPFPVTVKASIVPQTLTDPSVVG